MGTFMKYENAINAVDHFHALGVMVTEPGTSERARKFAGLNLYKKLIRIEKKLHRLAEAECNGDVENSEAIWDREEKKIKALIGERWSTFLHLNGDPRGYTIKLDIHHGDAVSAIDQRKQELGGIHTDFGGYVILAPDFE